MDVEPDPSRIGELNRRFHMTLYEAAPHPKLLALTESQLTSFDRYLRFHLAAKGRDHLSQEEHRAMLAAARDRDCPLAVEILRSHLTTAAATIAAFFKTRG
jgi:DNA-binding GntR family transcriptional regulator